MKTEIDQNVSVIKTKFKPKCCIKIEIDQNVA